MVHYQVKDPQGQLHVIDGPDGATPDEVMQQAQSIVPASQPQDQGSYWGDVGKSAWQEIMDLPAVPQTMFKVATGTPLGETPLGQTAKQVYKIGRGMMPDSLANTGADIAQGKPFMQTPMGQSVEGVGEVVKGAGKQVWGVAKDVGGALSSTPDFLSGTPPSQTYAGRNLRQRPLGFVGNVAMAGMGAKSLFRPRNPVAPMDVPPETPPPPGSPPSMFETPESQSLPTPNYLETQGGRGLYSTTGIRGMTVQKLAKRGQNPGAVGTNLIRDISDAGGIGSTSAETWNKINALKESAGRDVGSSLKAISDRSAQYGAVENPLEMSADKALKPLYDAWKSHAENITGVGKDVADYLGGVHEKLSELAQRSGGTLNLDHIDTALGEVGPLTHAGNEAAQHMNQQLYAALADTRDAMIQKIASEAKNPSLASNLLNANKKYSQYIRIMPDVSRASAMESVGQPNLGGLIDHFKNAVLRNPKVQRKVMQTGSLFNKGEPIK